MDGSDKPGYRPNVGAALFDRRGLVFVARRADMPDAPYPWQLPQGGIDAGEDAHAALLREVPEEIGTDAFEILAEHPDWLCYDFPPEAQRRFRGRYRGQRQRWFALRFLGEDSMIRLDAHHHPEFDAWRWVPLAEVPALAVPFKRPIYEAIARDFARFAQPEGNDHG